MNVTVSFSYYSAGTGANFEIDMTEEDLSCDDDLLCIIDDKVKEQWYAKILKEDVVVKDWFYIDQVSETEVVVYTEAYGEEWRIPHVDGVIKWADLNDDQQIHLSTTMWESTLMYELPPQIYVEGEWYNLANFNEERKARNQTESSVDL